MYKFKFILLICFISANSKIHSQDWNKIINYDRDAEGFMLDKQFAKAAESFKKASKLVPDNANYKFKIGFCYLNTDDKKSQAIPYLEEAVKSVSKKYKEQSLKEPNAPTKALYLLGEAYRINGQYEDAVEAYKKFSEFFKPTDEAVAIINQNIANCLNARNIIKDSLSVKIKNLGDTINNSLPNINAVISGDGKTLAYTNFAKSGNDIFIVNKEKGKWSAPKKITTQLNNKYLLTSFLSFDGKDLYLTSDDPINSDIYVTTLEKNKWIVPLRFEKPINTKTNENHVCLTKDGNTIYFTSDRKGGLGGFDIYKSTVNDKGLWGEPVNLGPSINTPFNEATPFLSPDEKYLFFSSEGHEGMGGYDIFYVNLEGTSNAVNLGYPVNNSDNNLFYFPENGLKSGLISFYDKNSRGNRDINRISISRYTNLTGKILTNATDANIPFKVSIFDIDKNDTIAKLESLGRTDFSYKVGAGSYKVIVTNSKYLPSANDVLIPDDYSNKSFNFETKMQPIPIEKPKLITEVLPVVTKKDSVVVEKSKEVILAENPKKEVKAEPQKHKEKPREIKKTEEVKRITTPIIKIENTSNVNSGIKISIYAVQLMALKNDVGASYFKNIDNIEITQSPSGFYRYSVGSTESMDDAMSTLRRVKELGYEKAFVRIDKLDAVYTIQLMTSKNPVDFSTFKNISDVIETKGSNGLYKYTVGSFSNQKDAKITLASIVESGYKDAYVRPVAIK